MVPPSGRPDARIMLVGEAPGEQEVLRRAPFVGASGSCLDSMLHEAGIMRSECFITNVCRERPPDNDIMAWIAKSKKEITPEMVPLRDKMVRQIIKQGEELLWKEIALVKPNVVCAFGNVAMWTLTGKWGIKSWRGSLLTATDTAHSSLNLKVIPLYHPAYILRDWSQRHITVHDLRRAQRESISPTIEATEYSRIVRPNYTQVMEYLNDLSTKLGEGPVRISCDIETRAGHIACLGLATEPTRSITIPFMCVERDHYWLEVEESAIILGLRRILTHHNARVVGQNFIYDTQYIYRHWGFAPRFSDDTMLGHHSCFSALPKGLDYISSLYCPDYIYWKDDGKLWDTSIPEDQYWAYNGTDCTRTLQCCEAISQSVASLGLGEQYDFQQGMFWPVLQAMVRGVRVDRDRRAEFALQLSIELEKRDKWFQFVLGHPLNPRSPKQLQELFYEDFAQAKIFNRKTGTVTLNDEALQKIATREPLLRPLVRNISECRSLGVFLSTFVGAQLDRDGRLRCSYNIAGTSTYRLSSSENAFGSGLNLQNIPAGGSVQKDDPQALRLPNVKTMFVPDTGYTFFDGDLDRADLQVVAWEAEDEDLKAALRAGVDIHLHSARAVYDLPISDDELLESHPNFVETKAKYFSQRQNTRQVVHATNYVGSARTVAANFGLPIKEVERFQMRWFQLHPGIKRWHERVIKSISTRRYVENRFGYRLYIFDRVDTMVPEAVAWVPQSTVAHYINEIWMKVYLEQPDTQVLLQVHDSLAGQFPSSKRSECLEGLACAARSISVPYDDPLVIPFSIKTSMVSWGDCK